MMTRRALLFKYILTTGIFCFAVSVSFPQSLIAQSKTKPAIDVQQMINTYASPDLSDALPGLLLEVDPPNPGPEESATMTVKSFALDLNSSEITWSINGTPVKSGVGEKTIIFKTGKIGSHSLIAVVAKPQIGRTLVGEYDIRPASLDILWEAVSSVPPFYRGKALVAYGGVVRVVALPGFVDSLGRRLDPKTLIYKWTLGADVLPADSGYGKNSIVVKLDDLRIRDTLQLLVTSTDGTIRAIKTVSVPTYTPKVVIYERHPLYGLRLEKGIAGTFNLAENEITLTAIPYFFNLDDLREANVSFDWFVNGVKAASGLTQSFRRGAESGTSDVRIHIENKKQFLQVADTGTLLHFGAGPASSGF